MRAAVVGAAGFIGTHLCRHLCNGGVEVVAIDRNPQRHRFHARWVQASMTDEATTRILGAQVDQAFILTGTSLVARSVEDPLTDLRSTVLDFLTVLEHLRQEHSRTRLTYVSSAAVYGQPKSMPIGEDAAFAPLSPYGIAKAAADMYARYYADQHGLAATVARPFSAYGPGLRKQVVWDTMVKLSDGDAVLMRGTGEETRDLVYIDDVCTALLAIATNGTAGRAYNVCTETETSIRDLTVLTAAHMDRPAPGFDGLSSSTDPARWRGSCTELRGLGWEPTVTLAEGLAATTEWFSSAGRDG